MTDGVRKVPKPVTLVILDGWGVSDKSPTPVTAANTPVFRGLLASYPHTLLRASGEWVGLRAGQMGDSNVGHLNIGAGRIVYQDVVRISRAIADGSFFSNGALLSAMEHAKSRGSALHLMGLLSDGGVHSSLDHLYALLDMAHRFCLKRVLVHGFLDGRDVPPTSAGTYLAGLEHKLKETGGRLVSLVGRFYAMDRDKRWDRVEAAYDMLTEGKGHFCTGWKEALESAYGKGETDEFLSPTVLSQDPRDFIQEGDSVVFFNFRADRARELTKAFVSDEFEGFFRGNRLDVHFCGMVRYEEGLSGNYAYLPLLLEDTLGEVVSRSGKKQLRVAETEKYAHVTFFLNGKKDEPFPGEDRVLVPSPRDVATYDEKPEMSAAGITEEAVKAVRSGQYDLIIINYANPDMVGHTGVFEAGVLALETVDECLGRLIGALNEAGGACLIIADHGNIEEMVLGEETSGGHTYHSTNPVPCILVKGDPEELRGVTLRPGILADVAPTVLDLMGLSRPPEMDRTTLIVPPFSGR